MKQFLIAAAVMIAMTACSGSKTPGETADKLDAATESIAENSVIDLTDDSLYRPGVTPAEPTLIDFNATWCGPCRVFGPVFHAVAARTEGIRFVSADVDRLPETSAAFGISFIPTVVFISTDGTVKTFGSEYLFPAENFENLVKNLK